MYIVFFDYTYFTRGMCESLILFKQIGIHKSMSIECDFLTLWICVGYCRKRKKKTQTAISIVKNAVNSDSSNDIAVFTHQPQIIVL